MKKAVLALLAAACLFVAAVDARASAPGLTLDLEGARAVWVQDEDREWYSYFPAAPDFVNERFVERWVIADASAGPETARVSRVIDGDTIEVTLGGETQRVRLLLVDTPEVHGGKECYGPEASAYVSSLLAEGSELRLERDVTDVDFFGRLLRYVYLADGRMLNELLVEGGYATVYRFPSDVLHEQRLRDAEGPRPRGGRRPLDRLRGSGRCGHGGRHLRRFRRGRVRRFLPRRLHPAAAARSRLRRPRVQRHPRAAAGPAQSGCRRGRRRLPELKSERYVSPATSGESGASSLCSSGSTSCANRRMLRSACSADMPP